MKIKTSELEGAALDWSVAQAVEAWKTAHEVFPTWTMDATFSGVRPMVYSDGQSFCQLTPNNPMRQDPQRYSPSTDWSHGGPLIDRNHVCVNIETDNVWSADSCHSDGEYRKDALGHYIHESMGPTPLIAACRAIVAAKLGDEVEVPDELL